jgi:hypothetical protein
LSLQAQVTALESALEADQVEEGSQVFQLEMAVGEYVTHEGATRGPFVFMDVVSLLLLAYHHIVDNSHAVKERADAKKAELLTDMDAYISTSYAVVLPTIFGGQGASQDSA